MELMVSHTHTHTGVLNNMDFIIVNEATNK